MYQKKRKEFGRQCLFGDRHAKLIVDINPDPELRKDYIYKNPNEVAIQCSSEFSEHEVRPPGRGEGCGRKARQGKRRERPPLFLPSFPTLVWVALCLALPASAAPAFVCGLHCRQRCLLDASMVQQRWKRGWKRGTRSERGNHHHCRPTGSPSDRPADRSLWHLWSGRSSFLQPKPAALITADRGAATLFSLSIEPPWVLNPQRSLPPRSTRSGPSTRMRA